MNADIKSGDAFDDAAGIASSLKFDSAPLSIDATAISNIQVLERLNASSSSSVATAQNFEHETKHSSSIANDEADIISEAIDVVPPSHSSVANRLTASLEDQLHHTSIARPERHEPTQKKQEHASTIHMKVEDSSHKKHALRRKGRKGNDDDDDDTAHPILKKRRVDPKVLRPMTHNMARNEKKRAPAGNDEKNSGQHVSTKRKRRKKIEVYVSCPASPMKHCKPCRLPKASPSHSHMISVEKNDNDRHPLPSTQDPETAVLNTEICGMLIEAMALSRASSLPLSSLYKMVMQTQPSLRPQRSQQDWLTVFARVLQEGEAGKGSGVFGKVESSGKVYFHHLFLFRTFID